jgi:AraC-like DNA-binding protein
MVTDHHFLARNSAPFHESVRQRAVVSPSRDEALDSVTRVFFPHEVVVHGGGQNLDFHHSSAALGDISLNQIAYGADVDVRITELQRTHFVFVIALTGQATVEYSQRSWGFQPGDCVLMAPNIRYNFEMSRDHTHLALGIPCDRLIGSGRPYEAVHNVVERADDAPHGGAAHLMGFIEYICGELHRGSPIFGLREVVTANENSLLAMMRATLFDREAVVRQPSVLPSFVRRAEQFISLHLKDDIQLSDIVEASGVPERTLYHGFERFMGHSPMRWLRLRRLESARADIIASGGEVSVTSLANQYWIGHGGRFANMYREIYGETPSATLTRSRQAALRVAVMADAKAAQSVQ